MRKISDRTCDTACALRTTSIKSMHGVQALQSRYRSSALRKFAAFIRTPIPVSSDKRSCRFVQRVFLATVQVDCASIAMLFATATFLQHVQKRNVKIRIPHIKHEPNDWAVLKITAVSLVKCQGIRPGRSKRIFHPSVVTFSPSLITVSFERKSTTPFEGCLRRPAPIIKTAPQDRAHRPLTAAKRLLKQ